MSIILAIEPDRRRAAQLTGMARVHLKAELLVAPNAAEAVEALAGRVPDVLLTAPLLPSQDETAIGDYLRQLGSAAGHVQTLTIPLLASGFGERDRPVFSAFRRGRAQRTEAEGCDPAVFAEQITEYLREAKERRATPSLVEVTPTGIEPGSEPVPFTRALTKPGGVTQLLASLFPADEEKERAEFFAKPYDDRFPSVNKSPLTESSVFPATADSPRLIPDRTTPDHAQSDFGPTYRFEDVPPIPVVASADDELQAFQQSATAAFVPEPFASPDPLDLPSPLQVATASSATIEPIAVAALPQKRGRKVVTPEDEWRFFDPRQCGFPALIAKLDEIAARDTDN